LVQCGASAYALGRHVTPRDAEVVELLLSSVGFCIEVREKQLDAVTGAPLRLLGTLGVCLFSEF
jgi:pyrroline-5-carboxylate reductase